MFGPVGFADVAAQGDFWHFQAKDFVTALIALAAFLTAVTNVWVAYLRRQKIKCDVGEALRIGYGPRPLHYLMFKIDVYALNKGARPGVITRMAIEVRGHQTVKLLHWTEVSKTENIAPKGTARKIWTDFAGFASPILVPKYDAKLVEAVFVNDKSGGDLVVGHEYKFRLYFWMAGRKKPIRGRVRNVKITPDDDEVLQNESTVNEKGIRARFLYLTASDGKDFRAPISVQQTATREEIPTPESPGFRDDGAKK